MADSRSNEALIAAIRAKDKIERDLERDLEKAINERDAAEEAMSQAYYVVTGRSPEWSNKFGYAEALEDIGDVVAALKASIKPELA